MAGALSTAAQPPRLAVGFVAAVLFFVPGMVWDAAVGARIDPPGLLAEPWDDIEQAEAQHTLRTIASRLLPEMDFESARVPAEDVVAALEIRANELSTDPQGPRFARAAREARELLPHGPFEAFAIAEAQAFGAMVDGVLAFAPRGIVDGVRAAVVTAPMALASRDPVSATVLGLWSGLLGALALGALARMEAIQVAGRPLLGARAAFGFAVSRWSSLVLAWALPLAMAAVLALVCAAFGLLFRFDAGAVAGGVLYLVQLAVGALGGLMLLVGTVGSVHAPAAVACDGLEALDASQRGAIYFLARPLLWAITLAVTVAIAAVGITLLRIVGAVLTGVPAAAVEFGSAGRAATDSLTIVPGAWHVPHGASAVAIWTWVHLLGLVVVGGAVSLVAGTLTRAFLLLREACDGQPVDETWPFDRPAEVSDAVTPKAP